MLQKRFQRRESIKTTPMLKPSRYNFFVPYRDKVMLAFNAVSKAVGRFTKQQFEVVQAILANSNEPVIGNAEKIKIKRYLLQNGFIIPEHTDELNLLRNRNRSGIKSRQCFDLILLPTLDCNFNCFYCYEEHRPETMQPDVINRIKKLGKQVLPNYRSFNLSWFGGEPLLEIDIIVELSEYFQNLCRRHDVHFNNIITTNGYLLNQKTIDTFKEVNLKSYYITIDGPAHQHNQFRTHKTEEETFETIVEGITRTVKTIPDARIILRVNYNCDNFDDIPELFDAFGEGIRKNIHLLLRQIFGKQADTNSLPNKNIRERLLYSQAALKGYRINLENVVLGPKETYCYADREGSLIISPQGELFKCAVSNFERKDRLGKLDAAGHMKWDQDRYGQWQSVDPFANTRCQKCKYLPLCMGGCRIIRLQEGYSKQCSQPFEHVDMLVKNLMRENS